MGVHQRDKTKKQEKYPPEHHPFTTHVQVCGRSIDWYRQSFVDV